MRQYGLAYTLSLTDDQLRGMAANRLLGIYKSLRGYLYADPWSTTADAQTITQVKAFARRLVRIMNNKEHVPRTKTQKRWERRKRERIQEQLKSTHMKHKTRQRLLKELHNSRKQPTTV